MSIIRNAPFTTSPPGYQLPPGATLGGVTLQVADLERSLDYYQRVVGLTLMMRDVGTAALGDANGHAALVHLVEKQGVNRVPARGLLGLYHFALLIPKRSDLGRFLVHLSSIGERAGMADHLVSEALYLTDPDGLGIEVYADRPRGTWKMNGSAIAMASDPLDVRDLAAAGGAEPWKGMPEGTRVGHVHLHVGSLEEARRFYHEGLGLDQVNLQFEGALFMSVGGYHHHLGTNIWAARAAPATAADARLLEWELHVPSGDDVLGAAHSLRAAGYPVHLESHDEFHVQSRADLHTFTAADPWGTRLRVSAYA